MPDATHMSDAQIAREFDDLHARFTKLQADLLDEGMAGSPGEWMTERMNELETEQKRRQQAVKRKPRGKK